MSQFSRRRWVRRPLTGSREDSEEGAWGSGPSAGTRHWKHRVSVTRCLPSLRVQPRLGNKLH